MSCGWTGKMLTDARDVFRRCLLLFHIILTCDAYYINVKRKVQHAELVERVKM